MLIAWMLEDAAAQNGWQTGSTLGGERELIEQFGVSRDTIREAIRILEARGSMLMQRGRIGGLRLLSPRIEDVASALATYLLASNFTKADLNAVTTIAGPIFMALDNKALISSLFHRTIEILSSGKISGVTGSNRASVIAARLLEHHGPPPAGGIFLGDEASLSDRLDCTRPVLREALSVLTDLSILKVRRGRGGGFTLIQPSPDAIVRRVFGLIASRHLERTELLPSIRALDLIRLRLAIRRLGQMDDQARQSSCNRLASHLDQWSDPVRWFNLQLEIDRIADNSIISILMKSFLYFLARKDQTEALWSAGIVRCNEIDALSLATARTFIEALRQGDDLEAERLHLINLDRITWALQGPDLFSISSSS